MSMPFTSIGVLSLLLSLLLVIVSGVTNVDEEIYYPIHLMRSMTGSERYPHGSEQIFRDTIQKALPRIGLSVLNDGSCAVIFHGKMGSGKSSIIERLLNRPSGSISSSRNHLRGGRTQSVTEYKMEIDHHNSLYLLDSPGFSDPTRSGKQFEAFVSIADTLENEKLPIFRLYLVLEVGTGNGTGFDHDFQMLSKTYGPEVAKTARLIVNKGDRLKRGKSFIKDTLIPNLQASFRKVFDRDPKILFTCAQSSNMGCIGQLIDDLCSLKIGSDLISLDPSQAAAIASLNKADADAAKACSKTLSQSEYEEQRSKLLSELSTLSSKQAINKGKYLQSKEAIEKKKAILGVLCPNRTNSDDKAPATDRSVEIAADSLDMLFITMDLIKSTQLYRGILQEKFQGQQMSGEELAEFWKADYPEGLKQSTLVSDVDNLQAFIEEYEKAETELQQKQAELASLKVGRDHTI